MKGFSIYLSGGAGGCTRGLYIYVSRRACPSPPPSPPPPPLPLPLPLLAAWLPAGCLLLADWLGCLTGSKFRKDPKITIYNFEKMN
jgi:hypothetical protein